MNEQKLTAEQIAAFQAEYDQLLGKIFAALQGQRTQMVMPALARMTGRALLQVQAESRGHALVLFLEQVLDHTGPIQGVNIEGEEPQRRAH